MKQYLMSVFYVEGQPAFSVEGDADPDEATMQQMFDDVAAFNETVQQAGAWVFGGGLHTPDTATVVRAKNGDVTTTDGPFAEAKEQIGGFWVIKAPDLDAALAWAGKASTACRAPVEVRPFQDDAED